MTWNESNPRLRTHIPREPRIAKTIVAAPAAEPITVEEVKAHLRITSDDENDYLESLIMAACRHLQTICDRSFITQAWDIFLYSFCGEIKVPLPPLQSVTWLKYIDSVGALQTLDNSLYQVDTKSDIGRIFPAYNTAWPVTRAVPNAVQLRVIAGYGDEGADVPEEIKHAMKLLVGEWYEKREATSPDPAQPLPFAVDALIAPYRVYGF